MPHPEETLQEIFTRFQIPGDFLHSEICPVGHINDTHTATYDQGGVRVRYLHQKINRTVFKHPAAVMHNVVHVTRHLRRKLVQAGAADLTRRCLTVVPTRTGESFYVDHRGEFWRTFEFVEHAHTRETVQTPEQAYQAGAAFGEFQSLLADFPGGQLTETIPDFHHTRKRFQALQQAIARNPSGRAELARAEITFACKREAMVDVILAAVARGEIPERITHNDTKFSNVMLDDRTGAAMCVVDLDTVMAGCALYDFGDMVRSTTSATAEDERDLSRIQLQMVVFQRLARGYFDHAGRFLTGAERALMAFSGKLITFETGLRFLTDYLCGDTYFRVHRPHQNLDRCRAQFKLVESIEAQEEAMQKFVDGLDLGSAGSKPKVRSGGSK